MRKILAPVIILSVMLVSCGRVGWRDDVSASAASAAALAAVGEEGLQSLGEGQLIFRLGEASVVELVGDFYIAYNPDNYDELGILIADNPTGAEAIKNAITNYYFPMKDSLMATYSPALYSKITDALCEIYGNTVFYAILSPDDRTAARDAVKSLLKQ